jgi:methionyl-tRNA synthetase
MSKSLGNFIDLASLRKYIATYSLDALRYYMLRAAPFGSDLDFSDTDFQKSYQELSNVLGNCLNRTVKMIGSYHGGKLPPAAEVEEIDRQLLAKAQGLPASIAAAYRNLELQQCCLLPIELARAVNGYIDATEPFKLKGPNLAARQGTVLSVAAEAIRAALVGLLPILPQKAAQGLSQLGVTAEGQTLPDLFSMPLPPGSQLGIPQALFPKVEAKEAAGS